MSLYLQCRPLQTFSRRQNKYFSRQYFRSWEQLGSLQEKNNLYEKLVAPCQLFCFTECEFKQEGRSACGAKTPSLYFIKCSSPKLHGPVQVSKVTSVRTTYRLKKLFPYLHSVYASNSCGRKFSEFN